MPERPLRPALALHSQSTAPSAEVVSVAQLYIYINVIYKIYIYIYICIQICKYIHVYMCLYTHIYMYMYT